MSARIGVITFPGTLDDVDAARAIRYAGAQAIELWHAEDDLRNVDAVVVPGGFSYGDYLRAGAIASLAPAMRSVIEAASRGVPVLGICNGFQILQEAGLLPGAVTRNEGLHFICRDIYLDVENTSTAWTCDYTPGTAIYIPTKHGEGRFQADARTLQQLEDQGQVVFRYQANHNGSRNNIAGICNSTGRVVGLMPHPEHAIDTLTGPSTDGLGMFSSILTSLISS